MRMQETTHDFPAPSAGNSIDKMNAARKPFMFGLDHGDMLNGINQSEVLETRTSEGHALKTSERTWSPNAGLRCTANATAG